MAVARKRRGHCWSAVTDVFAPHWPNSARAEWRRNRKYRPPTRAAPQLAKRPKGALPRLCKFLTALPYMLRCTNQGCFMADAKILERVQTTASIPELKTVAQVQKAPQGHWVGDGFPVRTIFAYDNPQAVSPFLLMDYAGPYQFPSSETRRGV